MPLIVTLIGRGREISVNMKPAWSTQQISGQQWVRATNKQTKKYSLKVFFSFDNSNTTAFFKSMLLHKSQFKFDS